jgi:phospholipid transport system substrate-binding protein
MGFNYLKCSRVLACMVKLLAFSGLLLALHSQAEPLDSVPHQLVQEATEKVFALLKTGIDPSADTDKFIVELSAILDPVVAFDYIARGVLGHHGKGLSEQEQAQFSYSFKKGLVNTYGKGISGFQGLDIQVKAPSEVLDETVRRTAVVQEIAMGSGVVKVSYTMAKDRQGQWKMINLVLNGINFGKTFRGQFAAAVEKNSGDVRKTIQEWEKGVL